MGEAEAIRKLAQSVRSTHDLEVLDAVIKAGKKPRQSYASRGGRQPGDDDEDEDDVPAKKFSALVDEAMQRGLNRARAQDAVLGTAVGKRLLAESNARSRRNNSG
jgi:hypothetical protein